LVFKRRKKYQHTTIKTNSRANPEVINIQEESSKEGDEQEHATLIFTGTPTTSLPYIEETIESHVSSTSQAPPQPSIFTRY